MLIYTNVGDVRIIPSIDVRRISILLHNRPPTCLAAVLPASLDTESMRGIMFVRPYSLDFSSDHHLDLEIHGGVEALADDVDHGGSSEVVVGVLEADLARHRRRRRRFGFAESVGAADGSRATAGAVAGDGRW
jgi:hypothetical protein